MNLEIFSALAILDDLLGRDWYIEMELELDELMFVFIRVLNPILQSKQTIKIIAFVVIVRFLGLILLLIIFRKTASLTRPSATVSSQLSRDLSQILLIVCL